MLLTVIFIVIGFSYAYWAYSYKGISKNEIMTSDWSFRLLESNNEIFNINPMSDDDGMSQNDKGSVLDFEVRSTIGAVTDIKYIVSMKKLDPDSGKTQIPDNEVKVYVEDFNGNTILKPTRVSDLSNYVLFEKLHRHNGTERVISTKYRLKVWLDESVSIFDNVDRQFKFKIGVVNRQLKQDVKTYKLSYDMNGGSGSISDVSFSSLDMVTITGDKPSRVGYSFLGWSRNKRASNPTYSGLEKVSFDNVYDNSVVLYAVWKPNDDTSYKVEHYVMNTSGVYPEVPTSTDDKVGTTGVTLVLSDLKKTSSLYNVDGGIEYSLGKVNNEEVKSTKIDADGSKVIKLYYERSYGFLTTVSGDNVKSVTKQDKVKYYYNSSVPSIVAVMNEEEGYTVKFDKWLSSNTEYLKSISQNPINDFVWPAMPKGTSVSLTAIGTKTINSYNVTYDYSSNGGSSSSKKTDVVSYGNSVDLTPSAVKDGYIFVGWNTDKNAKVALSNYKMPSKDITLYAIYKKEAITYNVATKRNVSSVTGDDKVVKCIIPEVYNNDVQPTSCKVNLPENSYVFNEWDFNGWVVADDETTDKESGTSSGEVIEVSKDVNIVATWKKTDSATFYYYNISMSSISSSCVKYNGASTCEFSVPSVVSSSKGPIGNSYVGLSSSLSSMSTVTKYTSDINTYYAVYRTNVRIYRPISVSDVGVLNVYRNSFFTSTSSISNVLSDSSTGTKFLTGVSGLYGTFKGFATSANTTKVSYSSMMELLNSDVFLVFAISSQNIKINYDLNGGTGSVSSQTTVRTIFCNSMTKASVSGTTTISSVKPEREGYVFLGWYEDVSTKHNSSVTYKSHPMYYYADTYDDLYNAFEYNETSLYNHYKTYVLNGSENRSVAPYESSKNYNIASNKTLYAGWFVKSYDVNLTVVNGTISGDSSKSIVHGNNAVFTTVPASSSYDLAAYACNNGVKPTFVNNKTLTVSNVRADLNCTVEYHKSAVKELLERAGSSSSELVTLNQSATSLTPALTEYRYMGKSPNNYIDLGYWDNDTFSTFQYRIMGVFYTQDSSGNYTYRIKATRDHPQTWYHDSSHTPLPLSWDSSASSINSGYGSNQWGNIGSYKGSALMRLINPGYSSESVGGSLWWNEGGNFSGSCYDGQNHQTTDCNFYESIIKYASYVDTVKWYLGATEYQVSTPTAYSQERSTTVGYSDTGQSISKSNTWFGKVGLPYESDYGYASSTCYKDGTVLYWTNGVDYRQSKCTSTNWIYRSGEAAATWLMTPDVGASKLSSGSSYPKGAWAKQISRGGGTSGRLTSTELYFRPTFYLKPDVMFDYDISSNKGTLGKDTIYEVTDISLYQAALEASMK